MNSNKFVNMSLDKVIKLRGINRNEPPVKFNKSVNNRRKTGLKNNRNFKSNYGNKPISQVRNKKKLNPSSYRITKRNRNKQRVNFVPATKTRLLTGFKMNDARMMIQRKHLLKQQERSFNEGNRIRTGVVRPKANLMRNLNQRKAISGKGSNFTISIKNNLARRNTMKNQGRNKLNKIELKETKLPVVTVLNNRFVPNASRVLVSSVGGTSSFHVQKLDPSVQLAIAAIQNNARDPHGNLESFRPSANRTVLSMNERFSVRMV